MRWPEMRWKAPLIALAVIAGAGVLVFYFFQRQLAAASPTLAIQPQILAELEESLADRRQLARLDPENEAIYRERFERLETTVHRLQILEHNRAAITRRYELILLTIFAASVILASGAYVFRQARHEPRLARLQAALGDLAEGRTGLRVGVGGHDAIGRIAEMIERTSEVMARDRRRLAALKNLSAWQEAARRHAHEMRTPLTAARLEINRIESLANEAAGGQDGEIQQAARSAVQELERLARFTQEFTSFARLPSPELRPLELGKLLAEFVTTYGSAWDNLALALDLDAAPSCTGAVDRDMLRQVLVNLCDNASLALDGRPGKVEFRLRRAGRAVQIDVRDDGPGVATSVRSRLFEPYTTTRHIGKGMGLGLAIAKKILLDHQGDLDLVETSEAGSTFRLTLPETPA
jgi:signal transduction histidine kinase